MEMLFGVTNFSLFFLNDFFMKSLFLIVVIFFICKTSNGQIIKNDQLLVEGGKRIIIDSILSLSPQYFMTGKKSDFKQELLTANFFIIPELAFKNLDNFSLNKNFIDFIDFTRIDTLSEVLLYNQNKLIGILSRHDRKYYYTPPLFNEQYHLNKIFKVSKGTNSFIFRMPFLNNLWWIIISDNVFVVDLTKKSKKIKPKIFFKRKFSNEKDLLDIIKQR